MEKIDAPSAPVRAPATTSAIPENASASNTAIPSLTLVERPRQMHDPEPREDHQPSHQRRRAPRCAEQKPDAAGDQRHPRELRPPGGIPREPRGNQRDDERRELEMLQAGDDQEAAKADSDPT